MILLLLILVLLILGVPLFVVIGAAATFAFALYAGHQGLDGLQILIVKMVSLTTKNVFLAIPFFVVSGAIMSAGSIAQRLVAVAEACVGWMRGGLAIASVLACVIFAAISGSSPVTLIAIGGIMFPAMIRAGYREPFALGLVTTAGSLGCLIPPSIPMLVYAISITGTSAVNVRELFMAGLGAALVIAGMLIVYAWLRAGPVAPGKSFSWPQLKTVLRRGLWALMLPVLILGGIYGGLFTPTEASAVSVVYAMVVEVFIHRSLKWGQLSEVVFKSAANMGSLLLIILLSFAINDFMVDRDVAQWALDQVRHWGLSAFGFMMVVNVFLVVTGMFMDSISAIILFTPLIAPAAVALGIDPLHLGVVFIVNMEIGYLAPPIATNLFVASSIFRRPFGAVTKSVLPTLGILCAGLLLITYVPTLSVGPIYALRGGRFYQPFAKKLEPSKVEKASSSEVSGKVMTLQEMMRLAKEQQEKSDAPDGGSPEN